MTECTCSDDIRNVAAWIRKTYKGSSSLVGMIATDPARVNAAKTILGSYATTSQKLMQLLDKVGDTETMRLSVLREACFHVAHSDEYVGRIASHLAGKERRFNAQRDGQLAVA